VTRCTAAANPANLIKGETTFWLTKAVVPRTVDAVSLTERNNG